MCVCLHTHTCVEHTEVQAYGGQRSVLVAFLGWSYFLRQGFWWNMELTTQTDRLASDPHGDAAPVSNAPALWLQVGAATLASVCVLGTRIQAPCYAVSPSPGEPSLQLVLSFLILNVIYTESDYTDKFNILSPWNQHRCATPPYDAESLLPIPAGSSDHTSLTLLHFFPNTTTTL